MDDQGVDRKSSRGLIPRFSLATLLVATTALAVWFSTFYRYTGSDDVRAIFMLAIIIAPGAAAVYSEGAKRAFWGGFFATMFGLGSRLFLGGAPRFNWAMNKPGGWGAFFTDDRTQWSQ